MRSEALSLRTREYVQAMKVMGGSNTRAVLRHIAPNAIGTIMVTATFSVADAIALIVALSYLGWGSARRRPWRAHAATHLLLGAAATRSQG